jgi:hypothetical protein
MPGLRGLCQTGHLDPVRLLVIDKRAGSINTTVINRATSQIWCLPVQGSTAPSGRGRIAACGRTSSFACQIHVPLLGGFRSAAPKLAAAASRSDANGAIPLAYTLRDTIADAEQAVGVYVAYRPQRLIFENAQTTRPNWWNRRPWPRSRCRRPATSPASRQSDPRPC